MSDLRTHLQQIYEAHGKLTPNLVVEAARSPAHPLHSRFEWDDTAAAEKYRLDQARGLIRTVRVRYINREGEPHNIRSFHSVRAPEGGYTYQPLEKVIESPVITKIILAEMRRDWETLKRRYERFEEFLTMIQHDPDIAA